MTQFFPNGWRLDDGRLGWLNPELIQEVMPPWPRLFRRRPEVILEALFDSAEERCRSLAEAVPEYEEVDFDDFPLQGPRTVYRDHEHSSICRVLATTS